MILLPSPLLLLLSLAIPAAAQGACDSPGPIALPIGNVTLTGTGVTKWGLQTQFGTPPQNLVSNLSPDFNDTALWPPELDCGRTPRPLCTWRRGGPLTVADSTTFESDLRDVTEYRPQDGLEVGISPWGVDTFTVNASTELDEYPIWYYSVDSMGFNTLGLGRNSTFLNVLKKQKKIASKTWSLFWGWQGRQPHQQMEGSFVLGGYDKAKTEGKENATMDFSDDPTCSSGLLVILQGVTVNHINAKPTDLLGKAEGSVMRTCVKPDLPLITFPKSVLDNFKKSLPGTQYGPARGLYNNGINISPKDSFVGNITFTLLSGLEITVPNHQLVLPHIDIDKDTGDQIYPNTNKTIMILDSPVDEMPILGQAFLSSAYLHVDNDMKQFTLSEANPTAETQLVTVKNTDSGEQETCDPAEMNSGGSGSGLSGGAIAGVAIGAVAGVALIALAAYLLWWRRRRRRGSGLDKAKPPADALEDSASSDMKILYNPAEELDGGEGHMVLSEMSVREGPAMELMGDTVFPDPPPARNSSSGGSEGQRGEGESEGEGEGEGESEGQNQGQGRDQGDDERGGEANNNNDDDDDGAPDRNTDVVSPEPMSATTISATIVSPMTAPSQAEHQAMTTGEETHTSRENSRDTTSPEDSSPRKPESML